MISTAAGFEDRSLQVTKTVILHADAGNRINQIGIDFVEDATAVGDSINPIVVNSDKTFLVGDSINHRVLEFDMNGKPLRQFPISNNSAYVQSIALDKEKIYMSWLTL